MLLAHLCNAGIRIAISTMCVPSSRPHLFEAFYSVVQCFDGSVVSSFNVFVDVELVGICTSLAALHDILLQDAGDCLRMRDRFLQLLWPIPSMLDELVSCSCASSLKRWKVPYVSLEGGVGTVLGALPPKAMRIARSNPRYAAAPPDIVSAKRL